MIPRNDYMVRATALDGLVRAFAIDSTATVAELRRRHATDPAVTAALGRLATGTLLFGAMLKDEDQLVTVRVQGNGPAGTLLASANGNGEVRGLVSNPRPDVEQVNDRGKLNVSGVVGTEGRLTVTRDLGMRQPHTSTVELVWGPGHEADGSTATVGIEDQLGEAATQIGFNTAGATPAGTSLLLAPASPLAQH